MTRCFHSLLTTVNSLGASPPHTNDAVSRVKFISEMSRINCCRRQVIDLRKPRRAVDVNLLFLIPLAIQPLLSTKTRTQQHITTTFVARQQNNEHCFLTFGKRSRKYTSSSIVFGRPSRAKWEFESELFGGCLLP